MTTVVCFWNATIGACAKEHWASCGYTWLNVAPVGLFATLWLCYGVRLLQRHGFLARFLQLNASTIHDQVAQGIPVDWCSVGATMCRKFGSDQQLQLQRYVKLCAMCSEWPTYTFAPLSIAFKVSGTPPIVDSLLFSLNFTHEVRAFVDLGMHNMF
ncbi:hypothetical protein SPRG_15891 [Saprolegnia parasitica CBS 223.65]|uniref:Uncharacterized protein n=1 Tax=Saprolegnia parasitica (strain CBS 223.65) TaxID=695850 RepID=A0A067BPV8_SAPPC|nr:hypothetical protein SPRG_15891 [Saprolegnia parasitica CBS 223.65]KDO18805.1 hypothetical protein SPRG_15891 [Saprolegnia parasitica CBS 223.65]|eukprot:XP_012210488.1 hypothetical protein SPRG_15891 [Saprolegnia parasitica CBS 223.65]